MQYIGGWGSAPDPAGEQGYSAPPYPLAGFEGLLCGTKSKRREGDKDGGKGRVEREKGGAVGRRERVRWIWRWDDGRGRKEGVWGRGNVTHSSLPPQLGGFGRRVFEGSCGGLPPASGGGIIGPMHICCCARKKNVMNYTLSLYLKFMQMLLRCSKMKNDHHSDMTGL